MNTELSHDEAIKVIRANGLTKIILYQYDRRKITIQANLIVPKLGYEIDDIDTTLSFESPFYKAEILQKIEHSKLQFKVEVTK